MPPVISCPVLQLPHRCWSRWLSQASCPACSASSVEAWTCCEESTPSRASCRWLSHLFPHLNAPFCFSHNRGHFHSLACYICDNKPNLEMRKHFVSLCITGLISSSVEQAWKRKYTFFSQTFRKQLSKLLRLSFPAMRSYFVETLKPSGCFCLCYIRMFFL